jgi:FdhD protein
VSALVTVPVLRPGASPVPDTVINEVPVALQYNGISHAVMLCTPQDLGDFALGFSLSEGILDQPGQLYGLEQMESEAGITLAMDIATEAFVRLKDRRRSMTGRTGCGICGVDNLAQVERPLRPVVREAAFGLEALYAGIQGLPEQQRLQQVTGAAHAACHVGWDGTLSHVREDIGRHNALDKTLGSLAGQGSAPRGAIIVTSRASLEMVQKTAAMGYGILAAVSAPSAAAIALAERLNVSLIGFLRQRQCVLYTHSQYLVNTPA